MLPEVFKAEGKWRQSVLCPVTLVDDLLCAGAHFPAAVPSALAVLPHLTLPAALRGSAAANCSAGKAAQHGCPRLQQSRPTQPSCAPLCPCCAAGGWGPLWNVWHFTKGSCSAQWPFIGQKTEAHRNVGCVVGHQCVRWGGLCGRSPACKVGWAVW